MKKIIPILLCLMLFSCKQETIPIVTVNTLPAELVGLGQDTLYDSIPFQIEKIVFDTIMPDSIVADTFLIDTFHVNPFFVDTIRLCANISYAGNEPFGPALQEYGFCINENIDYPIYQSDDLQTPDSIYGDFTYVMTARNTESFLVHAYAINPSGQVRGMQRRVRLSDFDTR